MAAFSPGLSVRSAWIDRGYWDPGAERRHGIKKDEVVASGTAVEDLIPLLADAVRGRRLFSDYPKGDAYWLGPGKSTGAISSF